MSKKIVSLAFVSMFLLSVMVASPVVAETVKGVNGDLELQMTIENTTIVIGEKVNITLTLKNIGNSTISIYFGSSQTFDLYLCDENYHLVCKWSDGFAFLAIAWNLYLEPNETYTSIFKWNFYKWADPGYIPPKPGNYYLYGECVGLYRIWWPAVTTSQLPITLISGPKADFTHSPSAPCLNQTVTFNASASQPGSDGTHVSSIVSYAWNFGDGNITTTSSPIIKHKYTAEKIYTVTLNVTDTTGLWCTTSKPVTVLKPYGPKANFTYSPPNPAANLTTTFDASSSLPGWNGTEVPIVNYQWNFGDGNIITTSGPTIVYEFALNDTYTVTLNVTDSQGLWNSTSKTMNVHSPVHDMAVTAVKRSIPKQRLAPLQSTLLYAYPGWTVYINVTVKNVGYYTENFTVKAYCENTVIGTKSVTNLAPNASIRLDFKWIPSSALVKFNWTSHKYHAYPVKGEAVLPIDANPEDNVKVDGKVAVAMTGDGNKDGIVSGGDLVVLGKAWGKKTGDLVYDSNADQNCDGRVDGGDLVTIGVYWGEIAPDS